MRESSRRGAPRPAPATPRAGAGRDGRAASTADRQRPGAGRDGRPIGMAGQKQANAGRDARAADAARLTKLIEPVLRALDTDLEVVKVASAGRQRVVRVIVDADGGISLDEIAEISREVSARLDAKDAMGEAPYTLEVSSPGVDRPLTQPRHWRRAVGRLVLVPLISKDQDSERVSASAPAPLEARVVGADEDHVTLEIGGKQRTVRYDELGPGRVQVEFGHLLEVADVEDVAGQRDLDDFDESWDGPDEEGPDGH